jgi:hypothetical protein
MNSDLAVYAAEDTCQSFEVTVGAPLCELMRRYSDATEEPLHASVASADGYMEFGTAFDLSTCGFGRADHDRHVDLQLAVA